MAQERAFHVRGTRMYPVGAEGPSGPFLEERAGEGPALLASGWSVGLVAPCGTNALVVLRSPEEGAFARDRLFFVHGTTAAPVEAPPAEPESHVPDYAAFNTLLARGGHVRHAIPSGTGALVVVG